jgi:hypothetical protein
LLPLLWAYRILKVYDYFFSSRCEFIAFVLQNYFLPLVMLNYIEDKDFKRLLQEVTTWLLLYPHIDPNDVFNDVIVDAIEDEREIYIGELRKKLNAEVKLVANGRKGQLNYRDHYRHNTTYPCLSCNQALPASAFYFVNRKKTEQKEVMYSCIECHKKYVAEYCKKKYKDPRRIMAVKRAQKKYQEKKKRENTSKFKLDAKMRAKKWLSDEKNREKARQRAKDWYLKNKAKKQALASDLIIQTPL